MSTAAAFDRAMSLQQQGRLAEALAAFDALLRSAPNNAHALHHSGLVLHALGQTAPAIARVEQALRIDPTSADTWSNLALLYDSVGRIGDAVAALHQAIRRDARRADVWTNLAALYLNAGRADQAEQASRQALAVDGLHVHGWINLALACQAQGRAQEGLAAATRACELAPAEVSAAGIKAQLEADLGMLPVARSTLDAAILRNPSAAALCFQRAGVLEALGDIEAAARSCARALQLQPDDGSALSELIFLRKRAGDWQDLGLLQRRFRDGVAAAMPYLVPFSFLSDPSTREEQRRCAERWSALFAGPGGGDTTQALEAPAATGGSAVAPSSAVRTSLQSIGASSASIASTPAAPPSSAPASSPASSSSSAAAARPTLASETSSATASTRRLRIAYLSADFHQHATALLTAGLFEAHDRARFETFAYSTGPDDGTALSGRVRAAFDTFVDAHGSPAARVASRIRADKVDVLIDLKGHTEGAPTSVMALRPAPIQVNYLGYPGTMGAPFIDYIVGDRVVTPLEHARDYSETIVQLPHSYQPNDRTRAAAAPPGRDSLGLADASVVFCCFNSTYKINPEVLDAWAVIVRRCPGAVLWLLAKNENDPAIRNLRREARGRGIPEKALVFATQRANADYLALYTHADVFLDTWPYNAHTTGSDALWCGCPTLCILGETFAGRVGASLLRAVGLPELIVPDVERYIERAVSLAEAPEERRRLGQALLDARGSAPLFDTQRTARALERAYVAMTQQARAGVRAPIVVSD